MRTDATKTTTRILASLSIAAGFSAHVATATPQVRCDEDVICIREVQDDEHIRLYAENRSPFPLTYTMRVKSTNVATDGPQKITRTLAAGEKEIAFELKSRSPARPPRYRYYYDWTVGDQNAVHDDGQLYLLPYAAGKSYRVIQGFGSRFSHTGLEQYAIDFRMPEGTPVHAARGGVVARVEERHSIGCWRDGCGRYANYVVILHDDGTTGEYYHLAKDGALVNVGETVTAGQHIALSGNTGHTTIPHLHFAVYRAVDWGNTQSVPVRFLSADGVVDPPRRGGRYQAIAPSPRVTRNKAGNVPVTSLSTDE
ncbi:MAG: M23 family metallopeptidase [Woeseiaceae bacterium]|nr:M23 family metallopeptidase [Woeseiaceae bacterium]